MTNKLLGAILLVLCFLGIEGHGQPIRLTGKAPAYAGKTISLYTTESPISGHTQTIVRITVQTDGTFSETISLDKTTYCQADIDGWQAYIYLEPGRNYQLELPPYRAVSEGEKSNPYFRPEVIPFGLRQAPPDDLNRLTQLFEKAFAQQESRYFVQIYQQKSIAAFDSLKAALGEQFPAGHQPYFEDYKFYRIAGAEYALHQGRNEDYVRRIFSAHLPDLQLPPCYRLFEQLFTNYLGQRANAINGGAIGQMIAQSKLNELEEELTLHQKWNHKLAQLVILKSVHDAFYLGQFSQQSLLKLLDKIAQSDWLAEHKKQAAMIKEKLTYLLPETLAPDILLSGLDGKTRRLSEFKGQYVYLHFTSVGNPICRQHLDQLKKDAPAFGTKLHVVNIIKESEKARKEQIGQQGWAGTFYTVTEAEAAKYRVRSYPSSYLISPGGKLKLSPALNPMDGFGRQFGGILQQEQIENWRNQSK